MDTLLISYILLPIVYVMYQAGKLAKERNLTPFIWQLYAYLISLTSGLVCCAATFLALRLNTDSLEKNIIIGIAICSLMLTSLGAGLLFLSNLKRRKVPPQAKRQYRQYDFKNALLFPRITPRGGFLWRVIAYFILMNLAYELIALPLYLNKNTLAALPWSVFLPILAVILYIFVGLACYGTLYYICHICIPRIRDTALSKDTLILLFIPGISTVALLLLLVTPSSYSK